MEKEKVNESQKGLEVSIFFAFGVVSTLGQAQYWHSKPAETATTKKVLRATRKDHSGKTVCPSQLFVLLSGEEPRKLYVFPRYLPELSMLFKGFDTILVKIVAAKGIKLNEFNCLC